MCPERNGFLSWNIFRARSRNEVSVYSVVDRHENSNKICKRRKEKAEKGESRNNLQCLYVMGALSTD
jgi:hypothetical protein